MEKLTDFINFNNNDSLCKMPKNDLIYLLLLLNNYYLEYRDNLGLLEESTFGIEIEAEYTRGTFYNQIKEFLEKGWIQKNDDSLDDGDEYTSPILTDSIESWQDIKKICGILDKHYEIKDSCGGHIHIGTNILENKSENWFHFFKLWEAYENIIFRFSCGEFLNHRQDIIKYAKPIANKLHNKFKLNEFKKNSSIDDVIEYFELKKQESLTFKNIEKEYANTIEIRCPNGTLEPIIWQNNINFFTKFILFCKSNQYDEDFIQKRLGKNNSNQIKSYSYINLNQAMELADMIFYNNLDKIYFLRQYLKSFEINNNEINLEKAKLFIKK